MKGTANCKVLVAGLLIGQAIFACVAFSNLMWFGSTLHLSIFQTMPVLPQSSTPVFSASETSGRIYPATSETHNCR